MAVNDGEVERDSAEAGGEQPSVKGLGKHARAGASSGTSSGARLAKELERDNVRSFVHREDIENNEQEGLDFMRGRPSDYLVEDEAGGGEAIPMENLYSSAGAGDLHREGDAPEALTDLPDVPTASLRSVDEIVRGAVLEAIDSEFGEELGINVEVEANQVTLSGSVDSAEIRQEIEETVSSVPGVVIVINEIACLEPPAA